jgi:hypothetical protein
MPSASVGNTFSLSQMKVSGAMTLHMSVLDNLKTSVGTHSILNTMIDGVLLDK